MIVSMRDAPPISPMRALLHPNMVVKAHKAFKRYRGETSAWPRVLWWAMLAGSVALLYGYFAGLPPDAKQSDIEARVFLAFYVLLPTSALFAHIFTTIVRLNETCVWCSIVHRDPDGRVNATLSIMIYRLPFLDPARENPAPWQATWWDSTGMDMILETQRGASQLNVSDIYDEAICRVRPLVVIPPTAKRYAVRRVENYGDIATKERGRLIPRISPQTLMLMIGAASVAAAIADVIPDLITLWQKMTGSQFAVDGL